VYVSSGNFTKNGGTIYGDKKEDAVTLEDPNLRNTGLSDHAVHVLIGALKRNSTAGPSVYLNSGYTGPIPGGGWE
jgi:hypothetical protein